MNIVLIGYRCTGKTTVGKMLAEKTGRPFIDADEKLVEDQGLSIREIVEKSGWEAFRRIEKEVIKALSELDRHVIASGGGAVLDPENVENLRRNSRLIWLKAAPETIRKRIVADAHTEENRPSLTDKGLLKEIEDVLAVRNPIYESAMHFSIDTDSWDIERICKEIIVNAAMEIR